MALDLEAVLGADLVLAGLAEDNIGWAATGCPAVSLSTFEGEPAFPVPGRVPQFVRVACAAPSFPAAMALTRRVRETLGTLAFNVGGSSSVDDRIHTVTTDFEVWTKPE